MPKISQVVDAARPVLAQLSHEMTDAALSAIDLKLASLSRAQKSASPRFSAVYEVEMGVYHGLKALLSDARNQALNGGDNEQVSSEAAAKGK